MSTAALYTVDREHREDVRRLGLWMFLATVMMLFAAFSSAYLVRRGGSDWSPTPLPALLWGNTLVLALSSVALEGAWRAGRRGLPSTGAALAAAMTLGVTFVGGQWQVWRQLQQAGIYLPTNPSSSFLYMMTAAHAMHVLAALTVLLWGAAITWRGDHRQRVRAWSASMGLCRTFWHFLLGVWLYLIVFISLF